MTQYGQENRKLQKEHKMADLSFQDVCKLLKDGKGDLTSLMKNQDDIMDFANRVDIMGAEIFNGKDEEYIFDMLSIIQSLACTLMIVTGANPLTVAIISKDDEFLKYTSLVMKLTVGLSAMEELR